MHDKMYINENDVMNHVYDTWLSIWYVTLYRCLWWDIPKMILGSKDEQERYSNFTNSLIM